MILWAEIPQTTLQWKQPQKLRKDGRVHRLSLDPSGEQLAGGSFRIVQRVVNRQPGSRLRDS